MNVHVLSFFTCSFGLLRISFAEYKLFVAKLPRELSEDDVRVIFSKFGNVREVCILRDGQGSRGCGFVKYATQHEANAAITSLHDTYLQGSTAKLIVRYADTQETKQSKQVSQSILTQLQNLAGLLNTNPLVAQAAQSLRMAILFRF